MSLKDQEADEKGQKGATSMPIEPGPGVLSAPVGGALSAAPSAGLSAPLGDVLSAVPSEGLGATAAGLASSAPSEGLGKSGDSATSAVDEPFGAVGKLGAERDLPTGAAGALHGIDASALPGNELKIGGAAYVRRAGGMALRMRAAPSLNAAVVAHLPIGTALTILAGPQQSDAYPWWQVRAPDGSSGWVAGTELVTTPEEMF